MPLFQENPLRSAVVGASTRAFEEWTHTFLALAPSPGVPSWWPMLISRFTATAAVAVGHFVTRFLVSPGEYNSISKTFEAMY